MIKKAVIVNTPTSETPDEQYLNVKFTDGTYVNVSEEELRLPAFGWGDALPKENEDV